MRFKSSGSKAPPRFTCGNQPHLRSLDSGNAALFQKPPEEFLENNSEGIDWERVASTVCVSFPSEHRSVSLNHPSKLTSRNRTHGGRTAKECEIKWLGDHCPSINHAQWSQPEISKCRDLVDAYRSQYGHGVPVDWVRVANELKVTSNKPFEPGVSVCSHLVRQTEHPWTVCDMGLFVKPTFGHRKLITRFWKLSRSTV